MNVRTWLTRLWNSHQRRRTIRSQEHNELTDEKGREELERMRKGIRRVPPAGF